MTGSVQVGFVGGHDLAGNVRTFLRNVRKLLTTRPPDFSCDLVVRDGVSPLEGFRSVDPGLGEPKTARGEIVDLGRALRRYVGEHHPDVLFQVTRLPTHGAATTFAGRATGARCITRLAGANFDEHRFADGLGARVRTLALKNCIGLAPVLLANDVVVLGSHGEEAVRRRGRTRNVHRIPQPVDLAVFSPVDHSDRERLREELDMPPLGAERVLLTVGRVSRRKGMETLRSTARELAASNAEVRWYVLGDGPQRESIEGVPIVECEGRVDYDRMPDYYRAADLYVHPSLHEGLPNAVLEATACGTPSVARDVGECSSVATTTFDDDHELPGLLTGHYDRVELDDRFEPDRLATRYGALLRGDRPDPARGGAG